VRCDNKNNLLDSTPCINCLATLLDLNIKRIVFSHKDNTFMSCNPRDLTISHISAGNNYIKRLCTKSISNCANTNNNNNKSVSANNNNNNNKNVSNKNVSNKNVSNKNNKKQ
jgi:hypothetical protein